MPQLTRGPLEAGVYWRRRVFVMLLALTLVFVVAEVLGGGSDGDDPAPAAARVGASAPPPTVTVTEGGDDGNGEGNGGKGKKDDAGPSPTYGATYDPGLLAEPEGTCADSDIEVTPSVDDAVALKPVTITLSLRTVDATACTWNVSAQSLTVKIAKAAKPDEAVWTSQDCPSVIATDSVVVRRALATPVEVTWNARESGDGCPTLADWAAPGRYTIDAAALGGEPAASTFSLITTPTGAPSASGTPGGAPTGAPSGTSSGSDQGDQPGGGSTSGPPVR